MPKWNLQQQKAIETKHKNIMVSASAGSGKTTVLIARLMELVIHDRIPINAILAMTFTEAAANEMKKRLAAALQDAAAACEDEQEKAYITRQLTNIQTAHISTIHSFCLSILQEHYYMISLDPQRIANIMDNGTMVLYQGQALEEAFSIQYRKQDAVFVKLCEMFSARSENDEALRQQITSLAQLASSHAAPKDWLMDLPKRYEHKQKISDLPKDITENFFAYLEVELRRYQETLSSLHELYRFRYDSEVKKGALLDAKLAALPMAEDALRQMDYEAFRSAFQAITHGLIPTSPDKEDKEYNQLRKLAIDIEDRMLAMLFSETQFLSDITMLVPYIKKLAEITLDYRRIYARIKVEKAVIDFDDMEHYALAILRCKDAQIAKRYQEQFTEIMVDEFQDSNDVQNALVQLICREDNVFRVGDIKQSIYGFRHAKPQLMRSIIDSQGQQDEVIYLSNNYRSKQMIVDFNNRLFKKLMNIEGFSCSYTEADDVDTGVDAQRENNVPICFHAIFHDEIKKENDLILSKNDFKASYIAHQIVTIKEKEHRNWKDFVVLVRGNARKENMKKQFDELHIPYFIDVKSGFYQSSAVQLMISALHALIQPQNDIALLAVLLSPLCNATTQELAQIKSAKRQVAQQASDAAKEKVYEEGYYSYLKQHPTPSFKAFQQLREGCRNCSLSETLNQLFSQNEYYAKHTTMQEKTNLDLLFEKSVEFESKQGMDIHAFLHQIEQIKDAQTAEAIPIGSEADVVRVMSIHQSKGLQFPVVFLWSTDKMTPIEFQDLCIQDSELGIALKPMDLPQRYVRTSIPRIAIEHKKNKEELEEEMRILYVATTRAQQQMHIVDCVLRLESYQKPLTMASVYDRGGYTSWILQTFLSEPDPLFTIQEVHTWWQTLPISREIPTTKIPDPYAYPITPIQFSTASQKKADTGAFTLQSSRGSSYGTMMHKMIELFPKKDWSEQAILHTASLLEVTLKPSDIMKLQQLYAQPLFQQALTGTCSYELPYLVKDGEEILHGYMDFVSMRKDHIQIIDFKTDTLADDLAFLQRYEAQLRTYEKAMRILYPNAAISAYIYSLHLSKMIAL